ncbi:MULTISPECIES: dihydroxyacetone kinase subunit DhaL [unclassified Nocardioides]|uniref:dihydroxyacetone kinase subunit DhaL n=1 Tax=unclassified Nocardioides TaxID=2615069 RepID=UPI0009EC4368|nr:MULTISPECIES: dihydroxyacetone kinase subunit DhaL [unclassified Nocardioides]
MNARDTALDAGFGERWTRAMTTAFATEADRLGELDRLAGDGDFGRNLTSAFGRVQQEVDAAGPTTYAAWLTCVSRGFLGTGGTSGPLFGMFFRELARCSTGDEPTVAELGRGLSAGLATVQRYGKAQVGHKTMVDALAPAVDALGATDGTLRGAAEAADEGARSTADIIAKRGRASYVGEASRGVLDPGAVAMAMVLALAADSAS